MAPDARAVAAHILGQVIAGKSLNNVMPAQLAKVSDRDRGLVQQLCYGTLRSLPKLKAVLEQLLDKPMRSKDRDVSALLLIGLYQLDAMRVPDHAAVAATVDATRALGKPWAKGLTNALLRRYLREHEALLANLDDAENAAHPAWMFGKIRKQWPDAADAIFQANNAPPPMSLRVNTQKVDRDGYLDTLSAAGIDASASTISPQGIRLNEPTDVDQLPGFAKGDVSVQDEAAQLAAILLAAQPGERILDACAAPGGKACHTLELQPALGSLVAADIDSLRLEKVAENLSRLELEAQLVTMDACKPADAFPANSFDRILVDAPCSASGVIRRHPDVKILRRPEDIGQLADQQLEILAGLWTLLKPGGKLLYATCSIFKEENSGVIEKFLGQEPQANYLLTPGDWGEPTPFGRQLLPCINGSDGLFYAILEKQA
jgi:16S rRNA (cytosine967-C5)-methyltransferase